MSRGGFNRVLIAIIIKPINKPQWFMKEEPLAAAQRLLASYRTVQWRSPRAFATADALPLEVDGHRVGPGVGRSHRLQGPATHKKIFFIFFILSGSSISSFYFNE